MFESLLLAGAGGLGAGFAQLLLRIYAAAAVSPSQPSAAQLLDYTLDLRIVAYVMAITAVSGFAVGGVPALRVVVLDVMVALRDGGRGSMGALRLALRHRDSIGSVQRLRHRAARLVGVRHRWRCRTRLGASSAGALVDRESGLIQGDWRPDQTVLGRVLGERDHAAAENIGGRCMPQAAQAGSHSSMALSSGSSS